MSAKTITGTTPRGFAPHPRGLTKNQVSEKDTTMYGHPQAVQEMAEIFGEPISVYTRGQAIEDGVLVDVTETASEAGFRWPVALTCAAWEDCVVWSAADSKRQTYQDESGRLWDVLWMASQAARAAAVHGQESRIFGVYRIRRGGRGVMPRLARLVLRAGPGDHGEPVITITMPGED